LLRQLQAGKTEVWMGDPAVCTATMGKMLSYARSIDKEYIHRIVWSRKLGQRFVGLYAAAGKAMADKRVPAK
jgi:hypothetical protein